MTFRARKICCFVFVLSTLRMVTAAEESRPALNGPEGQPLSAADWRKLEAGEPLVTLSAVEGSQVKRSVAVAVLPYPAKAVFGVVRNVEDFPSFMPYVKEVTLLEGKGGEERARFKLDLPWPMANRKYVIRHKESSRETEHGNVLITSWKYEAGSGNIVDTVGAWEITPLGEERCFLRYTVFTDLGAKVPDWMTNAAADVAIPKVIKRIRKKTAAVIKEEEAEKKP